ncbi:F-box/kelch-repeat protein At3g06240-like [Rutidosis leptorrhynchoides]|uniref:F-box/kelch-repeat protein At3g06240-like n=1 Tax=Rutidosis leptorrhynchoides TaxID=125765 RepID=UPI003A9A0A67
MSALNELPPDLIEAILLLLPPKVQGRFKSFLNDVPEDGVFLYSVGIKQLKTQTVTANRLNMNFLEEWLEIQGSCNGIVLVDYIYDNLYLVNLTSHKSLKVPDYSGLENNHGTYGFGYGSSKDTYGFGYDSSKDDYKVIHISYKFGFESDLNCTLVHVYSLRNNSWNKLPNFPYLHPNHSRLCSGVLLNNNLHWVVRNRRSTKTIAAFSLADEEFHEIEFLLDGCPKLTNINLNKVCMQYMWVAILK